MRKTIQGSWFLFRVNKKYQILHLILAFSYNKDFRERETQN